jgi:hypothetical protein
MGHKFISGLYLAQTYWGTDQAWEARLFNNFIQSKEEKSTTSYL